MKFKLSLILLSLVSTLLPILAFAYQNQWFDSYTENGNSITFSCSNQCVLILGEKSKNDMIKISGLKGDGDAVAGVMGTNQFYPITNKKASENPSFIVNSLNGQAIPSNAPVALVFQGKVSATNASILFTQSNIVDKIGQIRSDFRANEPMTFYSINLRYGVKLLGTPIVVIWYWVFFLGLIILYVKKRFNVKNTLYLALSIFMIIAIKNLIATSAITIDGLQTYSFANSGSKVYANLGDNYEFMSLARKAMKIDDQQIHSCKVYLECGQERPYCVHADYIFIKPCESTKIIWEADFAIYYQKTPTSTAWRRTILERNGSFVLAK